MRRPAAASSNGLLGGATREKDVIHRHYLLLCVVPTPPWFSLIRTFTILLIKA
jgi:hypothetical protein